MTKKIIIIDDQATTLLLLPERLSKCVEIKNDFKIISLKPKPEQNPTQFLEENKKDLSDIHLFIIDNQMFDFNGPELINYLKEKTEFKDTKIICYTSDSNIPGLKKYNTPIVKKGEVNGIIELMELWNLIKKTVIKN
jgi:DNA-binding NarL/FixJ family response regulator